MSLASGTPILAKLSGRILLVTNQRELALRATRLLGLGAETPEYLIEVAGLGDEEGAALLGSFGLQYLNEHYVRFLLDYSRGSPLALQAIGEMIVCNQLDEVFSYAGADERTEKAVAFILDTWLRSLRRGDQARDLIAILAAIPCVGMSEAALAYVMRMSIADVRQVLQPVTDKGLICVLRSSWFYAEELLILHDFLRRTYACATSDDALDGVVSKYPNALRIE